MKTLCLTALYTTRQTIRGLLLSLLCACLSAAEPPEVKVLKTPNDGIQPMIEFDKHGTLHLLYFSGDPMKGDLFYTTMASGEKAFNVPVKVNSQSGNVMVAGTIRGASFAIGRRGSLHIAWMGSQVANTTGDKHQFPMMYTRSIDGGRTFAKERNMIVSSYGLDGGGTVAADQNGNVWVTWHSGAREKGETGRQVWVTASSNDGADFSPEKQAWSNPTGVCGCCGMAAMATSSGETVILYRAARDLVHRDIYMLTLQQGRDEFEGRILDKWEIQACPSSTMSLFEGTDQLIAAWEEQGNVAFTRIRKGVTGSTVSVKHHEEAKTARKYPAAAASPDGHVLLSWVDNPRQKNGGRLNWRVFSNTNKDESKAPESAQVEVGSNNKPAAAWSIDNGQFLILH